MTLLPNNNDISKRIDVFVAERENITRSAVQKLLENSAIRVNGKIESKNYKIKISDIICLEYPELETDKAIPEDIPIDIVYEDDAIIIVNKAKGMVVHPAVGNTKGTLVNALLYHCGNTLSGINGVIRPGIVHRIDKDTSGLLIVAKNDIAHVFLSEQIKSHSFTRRYNAIVLGNLKKDNGTINAPIGRHPVDRKKMAIVSDGRVAITHYEVIERYQGFTYIKLQLETGRTHQIRVHMSSIGHPIIGDNVYGSNTKNKFMLSGQCLHAKIIGFIHPTTKEYMYFESELPEYFTTILNKLRSKNNE